MSTNFVIEVEAVGRVELPGLGPWHVHEQGRSSYAIRDSEKRPVNPTVWRKLAGGGGGGQKPDAGVVWASKSVPNMIVAAANAALEKQETPE